MASELVQSAEVQQLLDRVAGLDVEGGDQRKKQIVRRVMGDLFATIDEPVGLARRSSRRTFRFA